MRVGRKLELSGGALLLTLGGCTAVLDGDGAAGTTSVDGSGGAASAGGSAGSGVGPADCSAVSAPVLHARLLSPSQYEHAVFDLVGVGDHPAREFGGGLAARLDEVAVEQRANAAARIAASAVASLAAWSPCVPPAVVEAECGAQLIDKLGRAAFRRQLSTPERAQLQALFDAGLSEQGFAAGVEWLLTGLLQTPDFLYQFAKPSSGELAGQIVPLAPYELASRLSFFVWDSAPDETLLSAAENGALASEAGFSGEVERLLADARFQRGIESFYGHWLGLEGFREVARDEPALTSALLDSLERSVLLGVTSLYANATANFTSLLAGQSYYLDAPLRTFYGLSGGGPQLELVELPNEGRRGLLTHPGLLTLLARPNASDPIARGLFLQRALLCNEVPPPPQGVVIPPLPPVSGEQSTRARLERHTTEPLCKSCHSHIDPPGFALESYDEVGRFRSSDGGQPIDTSGQMQSGKDVDGAFGTGAELLERLARSNDAKRCFADHYLRFALARELAPEDACSLSRIETSFAQSGDLKQLVVAIAGSEAFRLRESEGVAP